MCAHDASTALPVCGWRITEGQMTSRYGPGDYFAILSLSQCLLSSGSSEAGAGENCSSYLGRGDWFSELDLCRLTILPRKRLWLLFLPVNSRSPFRGVMTMSPAVIAVALLLSRLCLLPLKAQNPLECPERRHRVQVFLLSRMEGAWLGLLARHGQRCSQLYGAPRLAQVRPGRKRLTSKDTFSHCIPFPTLKRWVLLLTGLTHTKDPENVNILHSLGTSMMLVHRKSKPTGTLACCSFHEDGTQVCSLWLGEVFLGPILG